MNQIIGFNDFKIGQRLRVKGKLGEDGAFVAKEISIRAPSNQTVLKGLIQSNVEELEGEIDRIDQEKKSLEMVGLTVNVDENSVIVTIDSNLAFSPLYKTYFESVGENQYRNSQRLKNIWGGPFNAQSLRQQLFLELIEKVGFSAIVETGTFRGSTTEYMHETSRLPVFSVEIHPQYYGYAKARFRGNNQIKLFNSDSRVFLRLLSQDPDAVGKQVFFYLDAHWGEDLPLLEEVEIIFRNWFQAVLMIDDFKVPGDPGYGYDDYGPGRALVLEYLSPLSELQFRAFFPSKRSELESGRKRGCVVLARAPDLIEKLTGLDTLTPYTEQS